ncbi:AAA family ATPase [Mycolicibacterium wolinskyi]|uniref:LuxR family transcriptional regulator n=1 Tax=Mycolicibacterium wolinskyi TaxID=59750 RepID=A0A1X2F7Z0_9MYCO|nr:MULTISPECIES: LuxR family transcriptional regulator [Mycolicibacterium]MCV7286755.1 AAA family ATPase [Mycolicibacterium wolinskyi]MCV7293736.1 AAA family ATPase [Mycolicibacterium goodii]ORX14552.1 LuxR family transcriptional regulator [Mycolicibacterium wolinskyi]
MSGWPFVARGVELSEASLALRDGSRGVVLAGPAGVGKTALARALADELEADGCPTRFVLGTETGQAVPFGAFHHALKLSDAHEPTVMLAAAHQALSSEPNLVIVVDDAHHLDPLSALLVQQLAVHGSTKLIVTIRSGETPSDAVTALWKEQLLLRLDIEPFTRTQTAQLVSAVLDGEVDDRAVAELHRFSSGSPLYLRGVLMAAISDGVLVRDHNRWRLRGELRPSADLHELVATRLDALADDEREVVEVVSTAEVVDWDVLLGICGADALARAERRGAVQVTTDAAHTLVQPGHPIIGEVTRRRCPVARARLINTILAQHLSEHLCTTGKGPAADVRARIQLARIMTRADVPPDTCAITDAAASAVTMSNLVLGEELARFSLEHGGGVHAAIVLADAISWQGRGQEAEDLLARYEPDHDDEFTVARWGCLRAANLFFGCGRLEPARSVLAAVRERVQSDQMLSLVVSMEVAFAFFSGDMPAAIALGAQALETDMLPPATLWAALATAGAFALSGRFGEVAAAVAAGERAAEQCESGPQRYSLALADVLAGTGSGQLSSAQHVCDRYAGAAAAALQADSIVTALTGKVELTRGRLPQACEVLQASVWTMSDGLPPGWLMLVAAWLAQGEAARGNVDAAAAALARAEAAYGPQVDVFVPELELARSWLAAATGETTVAQQHALRAAQIAGSGGMRAVELTALHTALRFGDRSHHARIQQLAEQLDCPLADTIAAHSRGLSEHDGVLLTQAAEEFEHLGALILAGDAAAHAAREHGRAGRRGSELEAATRAHWLASQCGAVTPALRCAADPLPLTDREWEIANLVGVGLSNRQIADRLCLSVRTVDGHLYRMFAKLGVEDRDQLSRLVRFRPAT